MRYIFFFLCLSVLVACQRKYQTEDFPELKASMDESGENTPELLKVLNHYAANEKDSLKFRSAVFLLKNMEGLYHFEGKLLDDYMKYQKLIRRDQDHGEYFMKSFVKMYGPYSSSKVEPRYDLETLNSKNVIADIDQAFEVWQTSPWSRELPFSVFCEHILPFKYQDAAPVSRARIYQLVRKLAGDGMKHTDPVAACKYINDKLMSPKWILTQRIYFLPHFKADDLLNYRVGTCRDMADLAYYTMRSVGIPVAMDFLPQWPYRSMGHNWNVVFDKSGKSHMFLGAEDSPGTPHKPQTKKAKVYRELYAINPASLAMQPDQDKLIPFFLRNKRIVDVSEEYFNPLDVKIKLSGNVPQVNYAYLSVFNNINWVPVQWGRIQHKEVKFSKMEGDIVYLPSFYTEEGVKAATDPILLTKQGVIKHLVPDMTQFHSRVTLDYISPIFPDNYWVHTLTGGIFQGADNPEFLNPVNLNTITVKPNPYWNEINLTPTQRFKFIRYLSAPNGHCDMGELEFYSNGKKLSGNIIGTPGSFNADPDKTIDKAMDGDPVSFFDANSASGAWVGLNLDKPSSIDKIRFSAAIEKPKGNIIANHIYQLSYLALGKWVVHGNVKASGKTINFDKVPLNALYRVVDLSEKRDSRIFTLENEIVIWR